MVLNNIVFLELKLTTNIVQGLWFILGNGWWPARGSWLYHQQFNNPHSLN